MATNSNKLYTEAEVEVLKRELEARKLQLRKLMKERPAAQSRLPHGGLLLPLQGGLKYPRSGVAANLSPSIARKFGGHNDPPPLPPPKNSKSFSPGILRRNSDNNRNKATTANRKLTGIGAGSGTGSVGSSRSAILDDDRSIKYIDEDDDDEVSAKVSKMDGGTLTSFSAISNNRYNNVQEEGNKEDNGVLLLSQLRLKEEENVRLIEQMNKMENLQSALQSKNREFCSHNMELVSSNRQLSSKLKQLTARNLQLKYELNSAVQKVEKFEESYGEYYSHTIVDNGDDNNLQSPPKVTNGPWYLHTPAVIAAASPTGTAIIVEGESNSNGDKMSSTLISHLWASPTRQSRHDFLSLSSSSHLLAPTMAPIEEEVEVGELLEEKNRLSQDNLALSVKVNALEKLQAKLELDLKEAKDQNDLLEFRILELEECSYSHITTDDKSTTKIETRDESINTDDSFIINSPSWYDQQTSPYADDSDYESIVSAGIGGVSKMVEVNEEKFASVQNKLRNLMTMTQLNEEVKFIIAEASKLLTYNQQKLHEHKIMDQWWVMQNGGSNGRVVKRTGKNEEIMTPSGKRHSNGGGNETSDIVSQGGETGYSSDDESGGDSHSSSSDDVMMMSDFVRRVSPSLSLDSSTDGSCCGGGNSVEFRMEFEEILQKIGTLNDGSSILTNGGGDDNSLSQILAKLENEKRELENKMAEMELDWRTERENWENKTKSMEESKRKTIEEFTKAEAELIEHRKFRSELEDQVNLLNRQLNQQQQFTIVQPKARSFMAEVGSTTDNNNVGQGVDKESEYLMKMEAIKCDHDETVARLRERIDELHANERGMRESIESLEDANERLEKDAKQKEIEIEMDRTSLNGMIDQLRRENSKLTKRIDQLMDYNDNNDRLHFREEVYSNHDDNESDNNDSITSSSNSQNGVINNRFDSNVRTATMTSLLQEVEVVAASGSSNATSSQTGIVDGDELLQQQLATDDKLQKLQQRIFELEKKEVAYRETLQEADKIMSDVERNYQERVEELESSEEKLRGRIVQLEQSEKRLRQAVRNSAHRNSEVAKFGELLDRLLETEANERKLKSRIHELERSERENRIQLESIQKDKESVERELQDQEELVRSVLELKRTEGELRARVDQLEASECALKETLAQADRILAERESNLLNRISQLEAELSVMHEVNRGCQCGKTLLSKDGCHNGDRLLIMDGIAQKGFIETDPKRVQTLVDILEGNAKLELQSLELHDINEKLRDQVLLLETELSYYKNGEADTRKSLTASPPEGATSSISTTGCNCLQLNLELLARDSEIESLRDRIRTLEAANLPAELQALSFHGDELKELNDKINSMSAFIQSCNCCNCTNCRPLLHDVQGQIGLLDEIVFGTCSTTQDMKDEHQRAKEPPKSEITEALIKGKNNKFEQVADGCSLGGGSCRRVGDDDVDDKLIMNNKKVFQAENVTSSAGEVQKRSSNSSGGELRTKKQTKSSSSEEMVKELRQQISQAESDLVRRKKELQDANDEVTKSHLKLSNKENELDIKASELSKLNTEIKSVQKENEELRQRAWKAEAGERGNQEKLQRKTQELLNASKQIRELEQKNQILHKQLRNLEQTQNETNNFRDRVQELEIEVQKRKENERKLYAENLHLHHRVEAQKERMNSLQLLKKDYKTVLAKYETLEKKNKVTEQSVAPLRTKIVQLTQRCRERDDVINRLSRQNISRYPGSLCSSPRRHNSASLSHLNAKQNDEQLMLYQRVEDDDPGEDRNGGKRGGSRGRRTPSGNGQHCSLSEGSSETSDYYLNNNMSTSSTATMSTSTSSSEIGLDYNNYPSEANRVVDDDKGSRSRIPRYTALASPINSPRAKPQPTEMVSLVTNPLETNNINRKSKSHSTTHLRYLSSPRLGGSSGTNRLRSSNNGSGNSRHRNGNTSRQPHDSSITSVTTPRRHRHQENDDERKSGTAPRAPTNLRVTRKVGVDSLLLAWTLPKIDDEDSVKIENADRNLVVAGYQIFVNGVFHQKVRSPNRTKALVNGLDLSQQRLEIAIHSVTETGLLSPPTRTVYTGGVSERDEDTDSCGIHDDTDVRTPPLSARSLDDREFLKNNQNLVKRKCIVIEDYTPNNSNKNNQATTSFELCLHAGDLVTVYGQKQANGYYYGEARGQRGLIRATAVDEIPWQVSTSDGELRISISDSVHTD